jgi:ABC-type branched-subunit amino acid transport system substrate-binding protein
MRDRWHGARARLARGRFVWLACLSILLAACRTVGAPGGDGPGPDETLLPVVVAPGTISGVAEAEAERLWGAAQISAEARRYYEALRTTERILAEYPASSVSGAALRLTAVAELAVDSLAKADAAAERYLDLIAPSDPRAAEMLLVQAEASVGDPARRVDRLLRIPDAASRSEIERGASLARAAVDSFPVDSLLAVVEAVPSAGPLGRVVDARLAVSLLEVDRADEAEQFARRSIAAGASGEDLEWAEGVLAGELPEGRGRVTSFQIAAVLPMSGPPAVAQYAREIMEGVEVAVATVLGPEYTVSVVTADDEGDPMLSAQLLRDLEQQGVVGVVGFLQDETLVSAAQARTQPLPIVSPTARTALEVGDAVYSLEGADLEAAASVARYAASRPFQRIAMLYPRSPVAQAEADAFQMVAEELGMAVVGRFTYEPGATFFENEIIGARDALRADELAALGLTQNDTLQVELLDAVALFMPIPPEDVEFLAPQVVHFGLDTLGIEMLGTSGWTDQQSLSAVDTRLTDGVVATAPVEAEDVERMPFRTAYEDHFQRTLVSSTPAAGYDAALVLLEALRPGRVLPDQVRGSFESLSDVPGATGLFSVVDGRLVRRTQVVRIENRTLVPIEIR